MKAIWKFEIPIESAFSLSMPRASEIIAFQTQKNRAYIWAIVFTNMCSVLRKFEMYGTGYGLRPNPGRYIGTIQNGGYVWHLFEIKGDKK